MTAELNFSTNPFANQANKENTSDAKIAQMKKEQEAKRAEAYSIMTDYKDNYFKAKADFVEKQSIFLSQQRELAKLNKEDREYAERHDSFIKVRREFWNARSERDLRMDLYQFRTDEYTKAGRINILDFA